MRFEDKLTETITELDITEQEYIGALEWLNNVGAAREFILLGDILHVSAHIIDHNNTDQGATPSTVLGPFYFPEKQTEISNPGRLCPANQTGTPLTLTGTVADLAGAPIPYAELDFWQSDANGKYDCQYGDDVINLRGRMRVDHDGRFEVRTIVPHDYPVPTDGPVGNLMRAINRRDMRPAHIHIYARADGYKPKVTSLYPDDSDYLDDDAVAGVKPSCIRTLAYDTNGIAHAEFDLALAPGRPVTETQPR